MIREISNVANDLGQSYWVNHVSKSMIVVHLIENGKKVIGVSKQRRNLFLKSFSVKENREIELWCKRGSGVKRHFKNVMIYIQFFVSFLLRYF